VSSSAAIEVATMRALAAAMDVELQPAELARLCQVVENRIVGAPCGIMDQMTSACGHEDSLLALRCQPAEIEGHVKLPDSLRVWGIDSGIRHAVSGADYGTVRAAAFMGLRIITHELGLPAKKIGEGRVEVDDQYFGGYLANITPAVFEQEFAKLLPGAMKGCVFLEMYDGMTVAISTVAPDRMYPVAAATAHPVYENDRVELFRGLLEGTIDSFAKQTLGELMVASHESYSRCGLGSDETDLLVEMVKEAGPAGGLYGAKITGGGSGGTVAILGDRDAGDAVDGIAGEYEKRTGRKPFVFRGSSPGAAQTDVVRVKQ
jgi:L-arabinokinase